MSTPTTDMLAGKVDGVGGFYDHNIALQGKGKSTESVVSMLLTPGEVELCRTDLKGKIKSPADWKGRHLGITDLGSSTDFLTQYLATKNGSVDGQRHLTSSACRPVRPSSPPWSTSRSTAR